MNFGVALLAALNLPPTLALSGSAVTVTALESPAQAGSSVPNLSVRGNTVYLSWIEKRGGHSEFLFSAWSGLQWTQPQVIASSRAFMVNWADFPSLLAYGDNRLVAHWLEKHPGQGQAYDYDVMLATSTDGGKSWSAPFSPHHDGTASEHGFVSFVPLAENRYGLVWLDGRHKADDKKAGQTLFYAESGGETLGGAALGKETLVDNRVCDCCQTTATPIPGGLIAAYRDRSEGEVRDISYIRRLNGAWTKPRTLHNDHWKITGCPVNGPALASDGNLIAAAWFTAANNDSAVAVKFSTDAGEHFGKRLRVDQGNPSGRLSVELLADGSAAVGWLEGGKLWLRRVKQNGTMSQALLLTATDAARKSGVMRLARRGGSLLFVWTDVSGGEPRVRVGLIDPKAAWPD